MEMKNFKYGPFSRSVNVLGCCCTGNQYNEIVCFFEKILNLMWHVRINETRRFSGNAIIVLFALRGAKESKCDERTLFSVSLWSLHLSHNP